MAGAGLASAAWRHGVKVTTFVPTRKSMPDPETGEAKHVPIGKRAWTATVFHISQTDPVSV